MPVNSHHKQYDEFKGIWKRMRDTVAGEDAVKKAGEAYLPPLGKRGEKSFEAINKAYRDRAMFYNATGRTLSGIMGAINRKPPTMEPDEPYVATVANKVLEEVLSVGRCGGLVDLPKEEGGIPYAVVYKAEDIINWHYVTEGDNTVLDLVVLREISEELDPSDPFVAEEVTRYRVLEINEQGVYQQRVYRDVSTKSSRGSFTEEEVIVPVMKGNPVPFIPFQFFGPRNLDPDVDAPPLVDVANVNLSHYRSSADLEHGRHFTALPTAWVAGFNTEQELRVGSGVAWVTDNAAARAGFLEFSGAGLSSLVDALREKEALMAVLGARLLDTAPRKGVETAEALSIRQAADTATAVSIANEISKGMTNVYQWLVDFLPEAIGEVSFQLNTDLFEGTMSAAEAASLVSVWQQGGISQSTLLWNFKRGELLPPDIDEEAEIERIASDMNRFQAGGFGVDNTGGQQPLADQQQQQPAQGGT